MISIGWTQDSAPEEVRNALEILMEEYPLVKDAQADLMLDFRKSNDKSSGYSLVRNGNTITIEYSELRFALRALSKAFSEVENKKLNDSEETTFKTFGIMLDCSRNAVMKVEYFKGWLRKLALLGYNMAMLYTEDTYQLPCEPYFGYLRGPYTKEELVEIDNYASKLGIEMIGCIQTLGHMEQILRWDVYSEIRDTSSVMLVEEEKTYHLIEKMIKHFAEVFGSRRIHLGMDETHDLGRGKFMDKFGYKRGFDIFNQHLSRVVEICKKYNLKPMIWSDMYFRMGSESGGYYDKKCVIPDDVRKKIPAAVELVYWDYYNIAVDSYLDMIAKHKDLGFKPIMGSGVWTWNVLWYGKDLTETNAGSCIKACQMSGVDEIFFTMWGDDGGFCDWDSALAGLAYSAECAYSGEVSEAALGKRFSAVCFGDYKAICLAGELDIYQGGQEEPVKLWSTCLLWDDPLLGIYYTNEKIRKGDMFWQEAREHYNNLAKKLKKNPSENSSAGDIKHAIIIAELLARKIDMRSKLESAYSKKNKSALQSLIKDIPPIIDLLSKLDASFRKQWLRRNKPFGLETLQIRIAGQIRRYRELADSLNEFSEGKIDSIPHLESQPDLPLTNPINRYKQFASGSMIQ